MRPRIILCGAAVILAAVCATQTAAHAYGLSGGGAKVGYTSPEDLNTTAMVGGHLEFEQDGTRLHLQPNFMYWKSEGRSDLNPNMDVYYHFGSQRRVAPYLGGGVGVNVRHNDVVDRTDTHLGANAIGGLRFPSRSNSYFLESRVMASDVPQFAVMGGVTFGSR